MIIYCIFNNIITIKIIRPCHAKMCFRAYADSKGPDQAVDLCSLISDLGPLCPQTESMDTIKCMNGEQRPG